MALTNNRCKKCNGEMFLDHVSEVNGIKTLFYSCVNPHCSERGKAYSLKGEESESQIKDKE